MTADESFESYEDAARIAKKLRRQCVRLLAAEVGSSDTEAVWRAAVRRYGEFTRDEVKDILGRI